MENWNDIGAENASIDLKNLYKIFNNLENLKKFSIKQIINMLYKNKKSIKFKSGSNNNFFIIIN